MNTGPLTKALAKEPVLTQAQQVDWSRWPTGKILAVDQALANGGWVVINKPLVPRVGLVGYGKIGTKPTEQKGVLGTLKRGPELLEQGVELLDTYQPIVVLHELPRVGPMPTSNREAGIVACAALHDAARVYDRYRRRVLGPPTIVDAAQAQQVKTFLTGDGKAEKTEVAAAILALGIIELPDHRSFKLDHTDAIGLALVWVAKQIIAGVADLADLARSRSTS